MKKIQAIVQIRVSKGIKNTFYVFVVHSASGARDPTYLASHNDIFPICVGQYDPGLSSHYLALHQSCAAAIYMESLMRKALVDPTTSEQAALLHQRNMLLSNDVTSNASQGPVFKKIDAELMESSINWQRLMVGKTKFLFKGTVDLWSYINA